MTIIMADQHNGPQPPPLLADPPLPADFEQALAELEGLAARMSDGRMGLDESIAAYQRGVALARLCQQRLDAAEQQVSVLQGQLLQPLEAPDSRDVS